MIGQLPTDWKHTANIYEVNVRQYTEEGTFKAFEKELPRLKDMGIKVLWFMPITPIAQEQKKGSMGSPYAAQDYTSVNPNSELYRILKILLIQRISKVLR